MISYFDHNRLQCSQNIRTAITLKIENIRPNKTNQLENLSEVAQTHTHTHIYIYILYIGLEFESFETFQINLSAKYVIKLCFIINE